MASDLFVDTSGFFALLVSREPSHRRAAEIVQQARADKRQLITTDSVVAETATLFKARREHKLLRAFFDAVLSSGACRVEWSMEHRFTKVAAFFMQHLDHEWSFTDCLSFYRMREMGLVEALTADEHFKQAGFVALLR